MPKRKRKIWELFDLLSEKERQICGAWLSASLGGAESKVACLFQSMATERNDYQIWKGIYPRENYDDNRMRNLYHELTKYLEDFLAFQQFRKTPFLRDLFLIKGLNRRGLSKGFQYFFNRVKLRWIKQPVRNTRYYRALYDLEREGFHHYTKLSRKQASDYFSEIEDNLEKALASEILLSSVISSNRERVLQKTSTASYLKHLANNSRNYSFKHEGRLLQVYQELFLLLNENEGNLESLIENVKSIWESRVSSRAELSEFGDKTEFLNIVYLILNHLIQKHNAHSTQKSGVNQFEFYVWMIEQELLLLDGSLAPIHYSNVISLGFYLKRWQEVWTIIEDFARFLPESVREDCQIFAKGKFAFYMKEYAKAIRLLNNKFSQPLDDIYSRIYTFMSLYEQRKIDDLAYQLELLKISLNRNKKITEKSRLRLLNKVKYFIKLCKIDSLDELKVLLKDLSKETDIASPEWLIEKCKDEIAWLQLYGRR